MGQAVHLVVPDVERFRHDVALYSGQDDLAPSVLPFVREGVERREPVWLGQRDVELDEATRNHGGGHGLLAIWREPGALVVEVADSGRIDDPLVGRGPLDLHSETGRGIWMANQLCELVQVRSGPRGTQVRLWAWQ